MTNVVLTVVSDGEVTERICLSCKIIKPLSEFQKDVHGYLQKKARCRECCNKKWREVDYQKNKRGTIKERPDMLKILYGVTWEHVVKTLDSQLGLCANRACGKQISLGAGSGKKNRAVIDHCHVIGKFRELLCTSCNLELGKVETNKNLYLGFFEYLEKHN